MTSTVGVIGRFQPFHWGQYEYAMAATRISKEVVIGITNPDAESVYFHPSNLARSSPEANPFSFDERCQMIRQTFERLSPHIRCQFRRCVLGTPDILRSSLGSIDIVALTIYDEWGIHRVDLFREAGYQIEILWQRTEKITSGSEIRRRIRSGQPWEHLVPLGSAQVIQEILAERGPIW